jgi:hypothetical protein
LVFDYTYKPAPANRTRESNWQLIGDALKAYRKFAVEKTLEPNDIYKNCYVVPWDTFYSRVYTEEDIQSLCDERGYSLFSQEDWEESRGQLQFGPGHWSDDAVFRLWDNPEVVSPDNPEYTDEVIFDRALYKSRPGVYLVVYRERLDSFEVLEGVYSRFKKKENQTVCDLIQLNPAVFLGADEFGLFDWPDDLANIDVRCDLDEQANYLVEKFGADASLDWKETPDSIDDFLILKSYHLRNKKNLRELRKDSRIKYKHCLMLTFDDSGILDCVGDISRTISWSRVTEDVEV